MAKVQLRGRVEIKTWGFPDRGWINQLFQQNTEKIGTFRMLGNPPPELISPGPDSRLGAKCRPEAGAGLQKWAGQKSLAESRAEPSFPNRQTDYRQQMEGLSVGR
ncbi:MAG: hypothetical protein NZ602_07600 [Thermoguttaceae bacterium]|nr:hypothetical protein [Thermoguttaceae bacterium]MDW8038776.1 hypothetical protein [Thermoguttaceae bacterium]